MNLIEDTWVLEFQSGIPVYKQIIHHIQAAVAEGRLTEGDQLPTIRALHRKLKVNPNTVAKAYRELELLGAISTEQGTGCFVAPAAPPPSAALSAKSKQAAVKDLCLRFAAEARSRGISFPELVRHLNA